MTTARTIIHKAFQRAGILVKTEQPSADEVADALDTLNDLFGALANKTLMKYVRSVENFPLQGGVATYTIGTGGDFNTTRPINIISGYVRIANVDYPIYPLADTQYDQLVQVKSIVSIPQSFVYDNNMPTANFTLYPVPPAAYQIFLRMEKPFTTLELDTELELPPGWNMYLTYKLAVLIAPEYGVPLPPTVAEIAREIENDIELAVAKVRSMDAQPMGVDNFNIYTGMGY